MPSGLTDIVAKGNTSFRDFALRCARAMDVLIEMKEEPLDAEIPAEIKPSSYHKDKFREASKIFYSAMTMRNDEAERLANEAYAKYLEEHMSSAESNKQIALFYSNVLVKVGRWKPPSPNHDRFKEFMISQLEDSLKKDCSYDLQKPKRQTGSEFRSDLVKQARKDMDYHRSSYARDVRNSKKRTEWVQALKGSLLGEEVVW